MRASSSSRKVLSFVRIDGVVTPALLHFFLNNALSPRGNCYRRVGTEISSVRRMGCGKPRSRSQPEFKPRTKFISGDRHSLELQPTSSSIDPLHAHGNNIPASVICLPFRLVLVLGITGGGPATCYLRCLESGVAYRGVLTFCMPRRLRVS